MPDRVHSALLCSGNSARSIVVEAVLNKDGDGKFLAYSGGTDPGGEVHSHAIAVLSNAGYDTYDLRTNSWLDFAADDASQLDFVFTVCDDAAGETCPV